MKFSVGLASFVAGCKTDGQSNYMQMVLEPNSRSHSARNILRVAHVDTTTMNRYVLHIIACNVECGFLGALST